MSRESKLPLIQARQIRIAKQHAFKLQLVNMSEASLLTAYAGEGRTAASPRSA